MASSHNDIRSIDTIEPVRPPLSDGVLNALQWTGFGLALTIAAIGLFVAIYNRTTRDEKAGLGALIVAGPTAFLLSIFVGAFFGSPVSLPVGVLIIVTTAALTTAAALLAAKINHGDHYY